MNKQSISQFYTFPEKLKSYMHSLLMLDYTLCVSINHAGQHPTTKTFFRGISRLGDGVFWYLLMAALLVLDGDNAMTPVLHMLATGLAGTLMYKWLKSKTLRPRPYEIHQDIWLSGRPLDRFSFPSGHTLHAVIFTVILGMYYPTLMLLVMPFTLLVAASRVILGLHYPSDVLAGATLGLLMAELSQLLLLN